MPGRSVLLAYGRLADQRPAVGEHPREASDALASRRLARRQLRAIRGLSPCELKLHQPAIRALLLHNDKNKVWERPRGDSQKVVQSDQGRYRPLLFDSTRQVLRGQDHLT